MLLKQQESPGKPDRCGVPAWPPKEIDVKLLQAHSPNTAKAKPGASCGRMPFDAGQRTTRTGRSERSITLCAVLPAEGRSGRCALWSPSRIAPARWSATPSAPRLSGRFGAFMPSAQPGWRHDLPGERALTRDHDRLPVTGAADRE